MVKVKEDMTGWKMWEHGISDSKITVIKQVEDYISPQGKHRAQWLCECNCSKHTIFVALGNGIRTGHVKSCGCWNIEYHQKHSDSQSRLYHVWQAIIQRCHNPSNAHYKNYGMRGIVVCEQWKNSYETFRDWALINGYDSEAKRGRYTIERINVNGNYCPENCKWATQKEQQFNKRNNRIIEFNGECRTATEWGDITGFGYHVIQRRIDVYGWSIEKALTTPIRKYKNTTK